MRIVFWGTPDFAIPSLAALLGEGHDVAAVVTQPDRPAGRGRELRASPVKQLAESEMIPVLQPERARDPEFVAQLRELQPELSVVVAYGQILSKEVLDLPTHGSINLHASLLPALRGAAPINWAVMEGHERTGVTIMQMVERMDAGPILFQIPELIGPDETASDLWLRLSEIGAAALIEALALLEAEELTETPQDESLATYAPRLTRETAHVDWTRPADSVASWIRGLDSVPGARSDLEGLEVKVFRPRVEEAESGEPGTVLKLDSDPAKGILVAAGTGAVWIREVKPAGRRRMLSTEWMAGRGVAPGQRLV